MGGAKCCMYGWQTGYVLLKSSSDLRADSKLRGQIECQGASIDLSSRQPKCDHFGVHLVSSSRRSAVRHLCIFPLLVSPPLSACARTNRGNWTIGWERSSCPPCKSCEICCGLVFPKSAVGGLSQGFIHRSVVEVPFLAGYFVQILGAFLSLFFLASQDLGEPPFHLP